MPILAEDQPMYFASFEGRVTGNTIKGASLIQEGPAIGHKHHGFQLVVDKESLRQFERLAQAHGKIKVKFNHKGVVQDSVGYAKNVRINGKKLVGDITLFNAHPSKELLLEMAESISDAFGISLHFQHGEHAWNEETETFSVRPNSIFSADFVDIPAANPGGLFEAEIDKSVEDMPTAHISQEVFDAYKAEVEKNHAALTAQIVELKTAFEAKPAPQPEPKQEEPKPDPTAALQAQLAEAIGAIKAFAAAPPSKQEPAPAQDKGEEQDPLLLTRAQFDAIPVPEREAFFQKGGRLKF